MEDLFLLEDGRWSIPNVPIDVETPCRNEDVSGSPGRDLWFGEGFGHKNAEQALEHAALLCETVCRVQTPEAYEACKEYADAYDPAYGVWAGRLPRRIR